MLHVAGIGLSPAFSQDNCLVFLLAMICKRRMKSCPENSLGCEWVQAAWSLDSAGGVLRLKEK